MCPRAISPANADHVIGAFPREGLSAMLAAIHRAGFGPQTRVVDGARGDVARQLERAGIAILENDVSVEGGVLIVVTAPGRVAIVAELFARLGAQRVVLAGRQQQRQAAFDTTAGLAPDIRIGADEEIAADA